MVGITLSPEQIMSAPPEVRRWLELQVSETLNFRRPGPDAGPAERHLVACGKDQVRAVFALIHTALPVVAAFFELGREAVGTTPQGLRVLYADEMARHCHLQATEQVAACLESINEAVRQVTGDKQAILSALDSNGHCLVAEATAQAIGELWQDLLAHRPAPQESAAAPVQPGYVSPYAMSVPASAISGGLPAA